MTGRNTQIARCLLTVSSFVSGPRGTGPVARISTG